MDSQGAREDGWNGEQQGEGAAQREVQREPQREAQCEGKKDGAAQREQSGELTARERAMLDFEARWWRQPSVKQERIRREFAVPPLAYFQQLNELISRPEALTYDPVTVRRLLRKRGDSD